MKSYYEVICEEGQQYQLFPVLCEHLYISNPYIIEAKVICNITAVFIIGEYLGFSIIPLYRQNHSKNDQILSH